MRRSLLVSLVLAALLLDVVSSKKIYASVKSDDY